jgi:L,D-transpeptidase catalytic domain
MKRFLFLLPMVLLACLASQPGSPAVAADSSSHPQSGAVLCLPGIYPVDPQDCLPFGPSQARSQNAQQGLLLPLTPLPGTRPDRSLVSVPFSYALLKEDDTTPVYSTMEDAQAKRNPIDTIAPGKLRFIAYYESVDTDNNGKPNYFHLTADGWVSVASIATRISAVPWFQGLTFKTTPLNSFGWIIPLNPTAQTKHTPGKEIGDYTGHVLTEYDRVQIYAAREVGGEEWFLVGPDEWLEASLVGRVVPNTTPPAGVTTGRWIEVNLFEQTLAVYDNRQLVFATLIATGMEPFWTRPGLFQIYSRLDSTLMRGAFEADRSDFYYLQDVPWTMYYDEARALHGAYWRTRFGFPQSHGCVNLAPGDAHWLYDWAKEGDWVYVWDPSGKTPTDPSSYTVGAP